MRADVPSAPTSVSFRDWERMSWRERVLVEERREAWARASFEAVREARAAAEAALAVEEAALVEATRSVSSPRVEALRWLARIGPDPDADRHMAELLAATK